MKFEVSLVLPCIILLLGMTIFPFFFCVYISLTNWTPPSPAGFVGVLNYVAALSDPVFYGNILRTLTFTGVGVATETVLGIGLATLLNRQFRGRAIVRSIFILPLAITPVVVGELWRILFHYDFGWINYFLRTVGVPPVVWLGSAQHALASCILVDIWQWTPFMTLVALAGLQSVPAEPIEAARIDGASDFAIFFRVTLPLMQNVVFVGLMFRVVDSLKAFDIIFALTGGGPGNSSQTLNLATYLQAFFYFRFYDSATYAIVLYLIVLIFTMIFVRAMRRMGIE
jgi:multiple sugar transport system permease protein